MSLHADRTGAGDRIVLVHGFTQTRDCWGPIAEHLATDHEVLRVDAPGHGQSSEVRAGLPEGGRLIADLGGEAVYVGYSMGGRFLVHLALADPELVRGLVLIGATAGIEDEEERARRAEADQATAAKIRDMGIVEFVEWWVDAPMFAGVPPEHQFRTERMENTVDGLENSVVQAGTGRQEPSWGELDRLAMPVLVVAGGDDDKYAEIGRRMVAAIGDNATFAAIEGAGHAAHLEDAPAFLSVLRDWLHQHHL